MAAVTSSGSGFNFLNTVRGLSFDQEACCDIQSECQDFLGD